VWDAFARTGLTEWRELVAAGARPHAAMFSSALGCHTSKRTSPAAPAGPRGPKHHGWRGSAELPHQHHRVSGERGLLCECTLTSNSEGAEAELQLARLAQVVILILF